MKPTDEATPSDQADGATGIDDVTDHDQAEDHEGATEEQVGDRTGPGAGYDEDPEQEKNEGGVV